MTECFDVYDVYDDENVKCGGIVNHLNSCSDGPCVVWQCNATRQAVFDSHGQRSATIQGPPILTHIVDPSGPTEQSTEMHEVCGVGCCVHSVT